MKAITLKDFGGPEMMLFTEVDTPSPGDNQILIQVKATSVNRPDIIQRQGNYPHRPEIRKFSGLRSPASSNLPAKTLPATGPVIEYSHW